MRTRPDAPRGVDVVVIGGGMAGVSLARELSATMSVVVVEAAQALGTKTTGRSAAAWIASYGPDPVRRLTLASRPFLDDPDIPLHGPLVTPCPYVVVGRLGEGDLVARDQQAVAGLPALAEHVELVDGHEAVARYPVLRPGRIEAALVDHSAQALDVAGLLQGYAVDARARGAQILLGSRVVRLVRRGEEWEVGLEGGQTLSARMVIDAAGAWADEVAVLAGIPPLGLQPRRRSVVLTRAPEGLDPAEMPFLNAVTETWYVKPESGGLLLSPEDATPHPPGDPRPDDLEIARAIEEVNDATVLGVRSVRTSWAGLRTFAPDGLPVVGPDPLEPSFVWFAGQGGYGIQLAPALARLGAAVVTGSDLPGDLGAHGVTAAELAATRFHGGH